MMATPRLKANTQDLMAAFGVAHMTIYNWRAGKSGKTPLPCVLEDPKAEKSRVSFLPSKIKTWARQNDVEFVVPLDKVLATSGGLRKTPGPKPKRVKH